MRKSRRAFVAVGILSLAAVFCVRLLPTGDTLATKPTTSPAVNAGNALGAKLTRCWLFYEGSGTTVHDLCASPVNGTVSGTGTWATDGNGDPAYSCASGTARVGLASAVTTSGSAWSIAFRGSQATSGFSGMVLGDDTTTSNYVWLDGGTGLSVKVNGSALATFTSTTTFTGLDNFLLVYDGTHLNAYHNGTAMTPTGTGASPQVLTIKSLASGYNGNYNLVGTLDYVYLFDGYTATSADATSLNTSPYQVVQSGSVALGAGTASVSSFTATTVTVAVTGATGGTSPYSYQLQRSAHNAGSWSNVGSAATGQTSSHTFAADTGLTTGTTYDYRVVVTDSATPTPATANSNTVSATPGSGSITLTAPVAYQLFQRGAGNKADVAISGTYTGSPAAIEANWSGNGSAYTTVVSSPSGGTFTAVLRGQPVSPGAGFGTLTVRFTDSPSVDATVANVLVGDCYVIYGQSNASGRGNTPYFTYAPSAPYASVPAALFGNDGAWKTLADPTDSATGQTGSTASCLNSSVSSDSTSAAGSVWPRVASLLVSQTGIPVAFVPAALGGQGIAALSPGAAHYDCTTLYGSMAYRAANCGSYGVRAVLWWQGETDGLNSMAQSTYQADLQALAAAVRADLRCPMVVCKLQNASALTAPQLAAVNAAIAAEWAADPNVVPGPDLSDLASTDGYHLMDPTATTGNEWVAAGRWAAAVQAAFYAPAATGGSAVFAPVGCSFIKGL